MKGIFKETKKLGRKKMGHNVRNKSRVKKQKRNKIHLGEKGEKAWGFLCHNIFEH